VRLIVLVLAGLAAVSALCNCELEAQSATAQLRVTATVRKNCIISTTPISFGRYDSIGANRSASLDATGTITVTCTKGTTAQIELGDGANSPGRPRRMKMTGEREYLEYEIYKNSSHTEVWGNGVRDRLDIGAVPNQHPRTFTAYGRVLLGQDATFGTYTDTVKATVLF
jgi:spore coat protein U-like protein